MADDLSGDVDEDTKALSVIYSALAYALRELAALERPCTEAEGAVAEAHALVRERMAQSGVTESDADLNKSASRLQ